VVSSTQATMAATATQIDGAGEVSYRGVYARLVLMALFWGGAFVAGRHLALEWPHFFAATVRYVIATGLLIAVLRVREGTLPRPTARQWLGIVVLGATGIFLYNAFFFGALAEIPASRAALIIATNPALTAVAAWLLLGQRFASWQWLGVALAFSGVAIVVSRGDPAAFGSSTFGKGEAMMFCGAASWVVYTLVARTMMQRRDALSPLATTAYASGVGLLLLAIAASFEVSQIGGISVGRNEIAAVTYLGVLGTAVGFVWFYEGVKALGATRASVFTNLVPIFGVSLAVLLLGEDLLPSMIIGGLVTLVGVSLTNVARKTG
jgi:drug/metabolite transporter (DMT)-like permease